MDALGLNKGAGAPRLGIGACWGVSAGCGPVLAWAFEAGCRPVDTADVNLNEQAVGRVVPYSRLKRRRLARLRAASPRSPQRACP